jgi:urease accessory protein
VKAHAAVTVARGQDGRCTLTRLRSQPPLTLRPTGKGPCGAQVHLVGSAAAPLGGDELELDVTVEAGAALRLRSTGAHVILPGRDAGPARLRTSVTLAEGAMADLRLEPTVLERGSLLHEDAVLVWADTVVLGRHEEQPGSLVQRWAVTRAGRPLLRTTTRLLDPASYTSPALLGDATVIGSLLAVAPWLDVAPRVLDSRAAVHAMPGAALVTALGRDTVRVADDLAELTTPWLASLTSAA